MDRRTTADLASHESRQRGGPDIDDAVDIEHRGRHAAIGIEVDIDDAIAIDIIIEDPIVIATDREWNDADADADAPPDADFDYLLSTEVTCMCGQAMLEKAVASSHIRS